MSRSSEGLPTRSILHGNSVNKQGRCKSFISSDDRRQNLLTENFGSNFKLKFAKKKALHELSLLEVKRENAKAIEALINSVGNMKSTGNVPVSTSSSSCKDGRFTVPNLQSNEHLIIQAYCRTHELMSRLMVEIQKHRTYNDDDIQNLALITKTVDQLAWNESRFIIPNCPKNIDLLRDAYSRTRELKSNVLDEVKKHKKNADVVFEDDGFHEFEILV